MGGWERLGGSCSHALKGCSRHVELGVWFVHMCMCRYGQMLKGDADAQETLHGVTFSQPIVVTESSHSPKNRKGGASPRFLSGSHTSPTSDFSDSARRTRTHRCGGAAPTTHTMTKTAPGHHCPAEQTSSTPKHTPPFFFLSLP